MPKPLLLDLCLASLAPDIVEMILAGKEPDGLSLRRLTKGLSMRWDEQRIILQREDVLGY